MPLPADYPLYGWEGEHASIKTLRIYELGSAWAYLVGAVYVYRLRNPYYTGIYIATFFVGGALEWIYDRSWFGRVTMDTRFISAWSLDGLGHPLAFYFIWGAFFGVPLIWFLQHHNQLRKTFGPRGLYVFLSVITNAGAYAFEGTACSVTYIYQYHHQPKYLIWGVPMSNVILTTGLICLPYYASQRAKIIVKLLPRTSESPASQYVLAAGLGFSVITTTFFLSSVINLVWHVWVSPWRENSQPF